MSEAPSFSGFPAEGLAWLAELAIHNDRAWFEPRKAEYKQLVEAPALAFVAALGDRLRALAPEIRYDLRTNGSGSLMRLYRDVRFSKDKSPYNTTVRLLFWEGPGKKTDHPGFYIEIRPDGGGVFNGIYQFQRPVLDAYRVAVANSKKGPALAAIRAELEGAGYKLGGEQSKRVPAGYGADHPRADLLRRRGLWAEHALDPALLTRPALLDAVFTDCEAMLPLHRWLVAVERPLWEGQ